MLTSIDINELMNEIDTRKEQSKENATEFSGNVNYDSLLRSISDIGKLIDNTDKAATPTAGNGEVQDITADLFATMSDSEMLHHFIPIRGVDYDCFQNADDQLKKHGKDPKAHEVTPMGDEFQLHRLMPQLNPLYQLNQLNSSALKSAGNEKVKIDNKEKNKKERKESDQKEQLREEQNPQDETQELDLEMEDFEAPQSIDNCNSLDDKTEPRVIKRRKPRTYKYNPKPLQHKISRSFVPDDLKDVDYWAHRKRNNEAAKKSREERRKKELEILNSYEIMKQEYSQIKIENIRLKARNSVLEKQISDLKCKIKCNK